MVALCGSQVSPMLQEPEKSVQVAGGEEKPHIPAAMPPVVEPPEVDAPAVPPAVELPVVVPPVVDDEVAPPVGEGPVVPLVVPVVTVPVPVSLVPPVVALPVVPLPLEVALLEADEVEPAEVVPGPASTKQVTPGVQGAARVQDSPTAPRWQTRPASANSTQA